MSRYAGRRGDAGDHPVRVAPVDRFPGERPENERAVGALFAAGLQAPRDWDGDRHGGGPIALADQVQDPVPVQGVGVVLDPHRGGLAGAHRVDAEQERQRAVEHGDVLVDLEEPDQLEPVQALGAGFVPSTFGSRVSRRLLAEPAVRPVTRATRPRASLPLSRSRGRQPHQRTSPELGHRRVALEVVPDQSHRLLQ